MDNKNNQYFKENDMLFPKQFSFQINLNDDTLTLFEKGQFTLKVFIDIPKAFDTVNCSILLYKLQLYGTKVKYLNWSKSYLKTSETVCITR